ncbi:MAG: FkbM family methyltransferase [Telluria sp.]|nr:FkbM family methyltransferase [Telluria sp.]
MISMLRLFGAVCPESFGLDFRLVGRFHRRGPSLQRGPLWCGNGFQMDGSTSNAAYISGVNERAYMRLLASLIRPRQVVYNVGANVGYLALWLASRFSRSGGLEIVGFEPDPKTAALMAINVSLNPRVNVRTEQIGLGHQDEMAKLYSIGAGDGAASLAPRFDQPGMAHVQVRIVKLDTYQATAPRTPHWLVIDVEGFGGEVIKGGIRTISTHRPQIAAEIHSTKERAEIAEIVEPMGYVVRQQLNGLWGNHVIWTQEG